MAGFPEEFARVTRVTRPEASAHTLTLMDRLALRVSRRSSVVLVLAAVAAYRMKEPGMSGE